MKIIPDNRKFEINHHFFDVIDTEQKAFWLGFMCRYSHGAKRPKVIGQYQMTVSFGDYATAQSFLVDLRSNYPIKSVDGAPLLMYRVQFQSKIISERLLLQMKDPSKFVPSNLYRHFLCGILNAYGSFCRQNYSSTLSIGVADTDIFNSLIKVLTHLEIKYTVHTRVGSYQVMIYSLQHLLALNDIISLRETSEPHLSDFRKFIAERANEVFFRQILFHMVSNDVHRGLSIDQASSKYWLRPMIIKRMLTKHTDEYTTRINAFQLVSVLPYMDTCWECGIYIEIGTSCQYCAGVKVNSSPYVISKQYFAHIRQGLKKAVAGKDTSNLKIQEHAGWTFTQLKQHIENQFEPWMTWENWGHYSASKWDDNDPSTWVWNLDHIRPHSEFHFASKFDPAFKACWALSNLRPLSGKQNVSDGAKRIRHKKSTNG